jgi:hypothetical protein
MTIKVYVVIILIATFWAGSVFVIQDQSYHTGKTYGYNEGYKDGYQNGAAIESKLVSYDYSQFDSNGKLDRYWHNIPSSAVLSNESLSPYGIITLPKGCYENETGYERPTDLVAHIQCSSKGVV